MDNITSKIIDSFGGCGHYLQLHEINFPLYKNPKFIFTDEMVVPKEKENGDYELHTELAYISKAYNSKEEAESNFAKLRLCYAMDINTIISDEDNDSICVPIRSVLGEKYMDSIMDGIVEITDITRTDKSNIVDYESGFTIDFNLEFKINGIYFTAEACTAYGDYTDGENPYISIFIANKDESYSAYIADEFNICYSKEDGYFTTAEIKSSNGIITTDLGQIDDIIGHRYSIPEKLNINLTSLGRFLVNRVYKEIEEILNSTNQGS